MQQLQHVQCVTNNTLIGIPSYCCYTSDIIYHISYHIVDLKWQNRLKVGTEKPKLKVKMQSVDMRETKTHI